MPKYEMKEAAVLYPELNYRIAKVHSITASTATSRVSLVHARWLSNLTFEHPAQYLVLREYRQAIEDAEARLERLTQQVADVVSTWSMAPVV